MDLEHRCFYQTVYRPSKEAFRIMYKKEGQGYCPTCTYDPENNPKCSAYRPIYFGTFEVE